MYIFHLHIILKSYLAIMFTSDGSIGEKNPNFSPYAESVIKALLTMHKELIEDYSNDPLVDYLTTSWMRINQLMGKDIGPYLDEIMPEIFKLKSNHHKPLIIYRNFG